MSNLITYLFQTNAFKISPENKPFWYTSGKIGPYFMNAQFLYGSEDDANSLLEFIDNELENSTKYDLPKDVFEKTLTQYNSNQIYKTTIDEFVAFVKNNIDLSSVDYISGGERRDWFFSNIVAYLLEKPHLTIFKDLSLVCSSYNFESTSDITDLSGKNVLHIADLLNVASSYLRAWIPAINNLGGNLKWSLVAVDRMQGGTEALKEAGVTSYSLINVDNSLFEKAYELKIINEAQLETLNKFKENPDETMRNFLIAHPEFIEESIKAGGKSEKRAKLCLDSNIYNL
ncbi:MAG: orotate phosphoribosyltransferase [Clostridia bacterium]|nr:orotate phosphoribosyltransferase [Clostridia bacterium]